MSKLFFFLKHVQLIITIIPRICAHCLWDVICGIFGASIQFRFPTHIVVWFICHLEHVGNVSATCLRSIYFMISSRMWKIWLGLSIGMHWPNLNNLMSKIWIISEWCMEWKTWKIKEKKLEFQDSSLELILSF